jgi:hypothetical protein
MDILPASRTLEQVDEFRRRSGSDCFFSCAEESGRSIEQGKKGQQSQSNWVKKKATVARGCGRDEKEKSERESFDFIFQCFDWPLDWAVRHQLLPVGRLKMTITSLC